MLIYSVSAASVYAVLLRQRFALRNIDIVINLRYGYRDWIEGFVRTSELMGLRIAA